MAYSADISTLIDSMASLNCPAGYFFSYSSYPLVKQLASLCNPHFVLPCHTFDFGFMNWNHSCALVSIYLQKLNSQQAVPCIKNFLSDIELLFVDQECRQFQDLYAGEDAGYQIQFIDLSKH